MKRKTRKMKIMKSKINKMMKIMTRKKATTKTKMKMMTMTVKMIKTRIQNKMEMLIILAFSKSPIYQRTMITLSLRSSKEKRSFGLAELSGWTTFLKNSKIRKLLSHGFLGSKQRLKNWLILTSL